MRIFFFLTSLFLLPSAFAANAFFTTVFLDDEGVVYVGVKHGDPGQAEIISFPFDSGVRTNIPLPEEVKKRDVIGLITEKQKLFVLTMGDSSAKDGPMLHVYDRSKNKWKKIGQVVCPTFTKATLRSNQMIFSCEVTQAKKGKVRVQNRAISYRGERLYRSGAWRFPEYLLRFKGRSVLLEGEAPKWDRLRLRHDDENKSRTISAEDLLQLPLPGADVKVPPAKASAAGVATAMSTSTATSTTTE